MSLQLRAAAGSPPGPAAPTRARPEPPPRRHRRSAAPAAVAPIPPRRPAPSAPGVAAPVGPASTAVHPESPFDLPSQSLSIPSEVSAPVSTQAYSQPGVVAPSRSTQSRPHTAPVWHCPPMQDAWACTKPARPVAAPAMRVGWCPCSAALCSQREVAGPVNGALPCQHTWAGWQLNAHNCPRSSWGSVLEVACVARERRRKFLVLAVAQLRGASADAGWRSRSRPRRSPRHVAVLIVVRAEPAARVTHDHGRTCPPPCPPLHRGTQTGDDGVAYRAKASSPSAAEVLVVGGSTVQLGAAVFVQQHHRVALADVAHRVRRSGRRPGPRVRNVWPGRPNPRHALGFQEAPEIAVCRISPPSRRPTAQPLRAVRNTRRRQTAAGDVLLHRTASWNPRPRSSG